MAITPPQPLLSWNHDAQDLSRLTKQAIQVYTGTMDHVGALDPKDCNFQSLALESAHAQFTDLTEQLNFYQNVSPSQELRDASSEAESLVDDFKVEASMRLDVFTAKVQAEENIKKSGEWGGLSPEEKRLVERMVLDGKRVGLALPDEKRAELATLKKELSQVCSEFRKNCNEENGSISFTEEELKGVPDEELAAYTKSIEGDKVLYSASYKGPDVFSILGHAENPETRKKLSESFQSRLAVNVPLFPKAMELRRKIATLLGYNTWADYVTEIKMAKTGKAVEEFLNDLEERLKPVGMKDLEALLALKKREHEETGLPFDGKFYLWDNSYYNRKFIEQTLDLDGNIIKQYFPVSVVAPAVMSLYQNLFGLRFEELKDTSTWHSEVRVFAVWEKDSKDESGFIGYFYLDLYPRTGKISHNAVWPILSGYELPDKKRAYPLLAMAANLAKPTPERPALMRHHDVWTFFHEMGHIFHSLLSRTKFARFHGLNVTRDFEEAPSQMLENWCWEPKVLEKLSSHYETQKPLSPELIEKLLKTRYTNTGLFYLQQVFFAKFDLIVHTDPSMYSLADEHRKNDTGYIVHEDYTHLWNTLRKNIHLHEYDKETPGQAAFQQLLGGYDVGYYGYSDFLLMSMSIHPGPCSYTWSQVFAADMYETVFKPDPLSPGKGKRYRDIILYPGGSRDEMDFLREFLGRPPNNEAFLRQILGTA
ncbi:metallopeptidase MepB [Gymnopilus junonius]|uniref:Metallopeptidase MepB n=1 Tax=Gymnopilus junonius TaxID=109634 RepID=A0A9P5NUN8_GYMJU|nr:metallopeptidase MepB [Gymnopilus junonius]